MSWSLNFDVSGACNYRALTGGGVFITTIVLGTVIIVSQVWPLKVGGYQHRYKFTNENDIVSILIKFQMVLIS